MIESIQHRRSIRKYLPEPVSPEKLRAVLEAGRLSPSGNNKQPWQFIVIQSAQQRQAVMEVCHNQTWMMTAPVSSLQWRISPPAWKWSRGYTWTKIVLTWTSSVPFATRRLSAACCSKRTHRAWARAGWVFDQAEIRPVLGIPDDKYVLGVIPLGYPEQPAARPRKR